MATGVIFTGTDFIMGANGFSTQNRYVRQVANPANAMMAMVEGPSIAISFETEGSTFTFNWRYECGSLTRVGGNPSVGPPAAGFATDRLIAL